MQRENDSTSWKVVKGIPSHKGFPPGLYNLKHSPFSQNGEFVASKSNKKIHIFRKMENNEWKFTYTNYSLEPNSSERSLEFSSDGNHALIVSKEKIVLLKKCEFECRGNETDIEWEVVLEHGSEGHPIVEACFYQGNKYIIIATDSDIKIYEIKNQNSFTDH